jgi:hypothetical protein
LRALGCLESALDELSDERRYGNGYIVYAKRGWAFDPHPDEKRAAHLRGFDTEEEVIEGVTGLQECSCDYCKGLVN